MADVVVLDDYQRVAARFGAWEQVEGEVRFVHEHLEGDALVEALADARVVVAMRERTAFDAGLLARLDRLELLVDHGGTNASIDVAAAARQGVTVCGTRSLPSPAAELTWALLLAVVRQVPQADQGLRTGGWQTTIGTDLEGRTLGLLGLGRLGQRVARVGQAFGMDVLAWSQNLDPDAARAQAVEPTDKDDLLARSDVVSLHLRLSDAHPRRGRRPRAGADAPDVVPGEHLARTARRRVRARRGAARPGRSPAPPSTCSTGEPLPVDHPLRSAPNTVLTPHLGYVTDGSYAVFYGDAVEDVVAWQAGEPVRVIEP